MPFFIDQLNRQIEVPENPKRIVSLVPSQTELLHHLGLEEEVIGITKFCVHPETWFRQKQRIGGTKNVNIRKIIELQPDLVIANKEENMREQIEELSNHFPVWISDVNNLADALHMIKSVGHITGKAKESDHLVEQIQTAFTQLQTPNTKRQTAYLIWKDPYMTAGGDTFINDMLLRAGFENSFGQLQRYPVITIEDLQQAGCDVLLLSSEPYPFQQKHIDELHSLLPQTKILLADGEMFSWYGSRLLQSPAYFSQLHQQIKTIM